jgi:hypothetical protein
MPVGNWAIYSASLVVACALHLFPMLYSPTLIRMRVAKATRAPFWVGKPLCLFVELLLVRVLGPISLYAQPCLVGLGLKSGHMRQLNSLVLRTLQRHCLQNMRRYQGPPKRLTRLSGCRLRVDSCVCACSNFNGTMSQHS